MKEQLTCNLKAHLIVAFASGAMGHCICSHLHPSQHCCSKANTSCGQLPHLLCNLNLALGDQRASNGCAQQVDALILGVGAEHGENKITHKLFAQLRASGRSLVMFSFFI
jgi:hypothetical protein